jgi:branched-subunit amino acid permease
MLDWTDLGIGWGVSLAISLVTIATFRRPLFNLLHYVCGTDVGARFWCSFFGILFVCVPLLLVSIAMDRDTNPADFLRHIMACAFTGLLGALVILGIAVASARPRTALTQIKP